MFQFIIIPSFQKHTKKVARISNIKETKRIAKEKKFGKMMLIIMALFFGTYFPTYLLKKVDFNTYKYTSNTAQNGIMINPNSYFFILINHSSASNIFITKD